VNKRKPKHLLGPTPGNDIIVALELLWNVQKAEPKLSSLLIITGALTSESEGALNFILLTFPDCLDQEVIRLN